MTADPTIIAAAIVTVIAALAGAVVTVINAIAASRDRNDARISRASLTAVSANTNAKADTIIEKATEIHTLTNSNLSKVTESLNIALEKISGLEKLITSMTSAKLVADALANQTIATGPATGSIGGTGALESLVKIDANTKAIDTNTKRTDATVQSLKDGKTG